jgi:hypothetical protein
VRGGVGRRALAQPLASAQRPPRRESRSRWAGRAGTTRVGFPSALSGMRGSASSAARTSWLFLPLLSGPGRVASRDDHLRAPPLWLGGARRGRGQQPWYLHLLTTEPVSTTEDAWRIV